MWWGYYWKTFKTGGESKRHWGQSCWTVEKNQRPDQTHDSDNKRKKRSQKESRRKVKKRKASRTASKMEKLECSSFSKSSWKGQFKVGRLALSKLTRSQVKYLRMIIQKGMLSTESVSYIQEHVKDFLGSSDKRAGTAVISDSKNKKRIGQMKTISQLKVTSQMKVEGMLTIHCKIVIAKIINEHFVFTTNNFGCLSDDSLIMSSEKLSAHLRKLLQPPFYLCIKFADPLPPPPSNFWPVHFIGRMTFYMCHM